MTQLMTGYLVGGQRPLQATLEANNQIFNEVKQINAYANQDFAVKMSDNAGVYGVSFLDSDDIAVIRFTSDGEIKIIGDNIKTYWGTGSDASISYDGTNLQINAQEVGSGGTVFTGSVGIGGTPLDLFHVIAGSSGATAHSSSQMVLEDNAAVYFDFLTTNNVSAGFFWSDPELTAAGQLFYDHSTDTMELLSRAIINLDINGTNQMVINSTGVGIGMTPTFAKLEIDGDTSNDVLFLEGTNALGVDISFQNTSTRLRAKAADSFSFILSGSVVFKINNSGDVEFSGNIGVSGDTNLIQLASNVVTFNGNVGINTTPSAPLHVVDSDGGNLLLIDQSGAFDTNFHIYNQGVDKGRLLYDLSETAIYIITQTTEDIVFETDRGGTPNEGLRIDGSTGNLGIATSDIEAWRSDFDVIEFYESAIFVANNGNTIEMTSNSYFDSGGWKYKATNPAANMYLYDGTIYFRAAASGTINTTITWTSVMTMNTNGVGIGVSPSEKFQVLIPQDDAESNLVHFGDGTYGIFAGNATATGMIPFIKMISDGGATKFNLITAEVDPSDDTGSEHVLEFRAAQSDDTAITNRDLFHFTNNGTSLIAIDKDGNLLLGSNLGVIGDTDLIQLAANSFTVNGTIQSNTYSGNLNSQSENPPSQALVSGGGFFAYDGDTNSWVNNANHNSFNNVIIDYPANAHDIDLLALQISKIKLVVNDPTYTASGGGTGTARWYYSKDGGASWTLVGSYASLTSAGGTIDFDTNSVEIDGDTVTGDVMVMLYLLDSTILTVDISTFTAYYQITLKTP